MESRAKSSAIHPDYHRIRNMIFSTVFCQDVSFFWHLLAGLKKLKMTKYKKIYLEQKNIVSWSFDNNSHLEVN